jgi:hypothetical protein
VTSFSSVPGAALIGAASPGFIAGGTPAAPPFLHVPGPSVPGLAIPGDPSPGYPGAATVTYEFTGLESLYYLQYLGPGGTLVVQPGQSFAPGVITVASGWSYPLGIPPADGRWASGFSGPLYAVVLPHAGVLAKARAVNVALQAEQAARPPAPQAEVPPPPPPPVREPEPLSGGALMLAEARAVNAALQAKAAAVKAE